jgi:6-pyruvoyltetrahydropterin/6-carboxytetrahydropterin synthase
MIYVNIRTELLYDCSLYLAIHMPFIVFWLLPAIFDKHLRLICIRERNSCAIQFYFEANHIGGYFHQSYVIFTELRSHIYDMVMSITLIKMSLFDTLSGESEGIRKTMYEVTIRKSFSAAHALKEIGGLCEALHGHNFMVEISVSGNRLNREDLLIDFRVLKGWIHETLTELDHKHLNALGYFQEVNPSSEQIAKLIHHRLAPKASDLNLRVSRVTVWESDDARVSYEDNGDAGQ